MGRRAKPSKGKAEAKRPLAGKTPKDDGARVRDLEKGLAEALQREQVLVEQQTATSEILRVIASSPTDLQPVFEGIARSGVRLGALGCTVFRIEGDVLRVVAHAGVRPERVERFQTQFPAGSARARVRAHRAVERHLSPG